MAPEPGSKSSRGSDDGVLEAGSGKEVDGAYFFLFLRVARISRVHWSKVAQKSAYRIHYETKILKRQRFGGYVPPKLKIVRM